MSQYTPEQEEQFARISQVQAQHAQELMNCANVVGVGIGIAYKGGEPTQEMALVVMVTQKMPVAQLADNDVLPQDLDGVRVDVQATGGFTGGFGTT